VQTQRLPLAQDFRRRPLRGQCLSVAIDLQAGCDERPNRGFPFGDDGRFEQALGWCNLQIVGQIENVDDKRNVEGGFLQLDVEVAEGHRVRKRRRGQQQHADRKTHPAEPIHEVQW